MESRSQAISSMLAIKGLLVEETRLAFQAWDLEQSTEENLRTLREANTVHSRSDNWLRNVVMVLRRRFDPPGRDRPLVELARQAPDPVTWRAALLWHATRDEFLLREFLVDWLYARFEDGTYQLRPADLLPWLGTLEATREWTDSTRNRVATGLLRAAEDVGLLAGRTVRRFATFHLPDEAFLYVLHALAEHEPNGHRLVHSPEWRMYLMGPAEVERELMRLHQFRRLRYESAGSLAQVDLPAASLEDYVLGSKP